MSVCGAHTLQENIPTLPVTSPFPHTSPPDFSSYQADHSKLLLPLSPITTPWLSPVLSIKLPTWSGLASTPQLLFARVIQG